MKHVGSACWQRGIGIRLGVGMGLAIEMGIGIERTLLLRASYSYIQCVEDCYGNEGGEKGGSHS